MKTLIKAVCIIDKTSSWHQKQGDVLINNGVIEQIADSIETQADEIMEGNNLHLSAGWLDMRVHACEPGYEHKEDLATLISAAQAGGFTEVALLPNTKPVVQRKESIAFLKQFSKKSKVRLHPMAAATQHCEGKDFTEMLDLHHAGAIAFSDGTQPMWHPDMLLKTLQYLDPIGALLVNRPDEVHLSRYGQMHEGTMSTLLGMKGIPALAEEICIMRDLKLLEYLALKADTPRLHFSLISTRTSVALIRNAKKQGLPVSCDTAPHYLAFDDTALIGFDTNLKVNPPFRTQDDVTALWEGLADGTIDALVSDHCPQDEENKKLEFDLATFGIIGLETAFAVANTHNKMLALDELIEKFTTQPRRILRLQQATIHIGQDANLTVFDPTELWTFDEQGAQSFAKNSPFFGKTLKGRAVRTFLKN